MCWRVQAIFARDALERVFGPMKFNQQKIAGCRIKTYHYHYLCPNARIMLQEKEKGITSVLIQYTKFKCLFCCPRGLIHLQHEESKSHNQE
jgi:hypothetical protein